jgi:hypothetical protein
MRFGSFLQHGSLMDAEPGQGGGAAATTPNTQAPAIDPQNFVSREDFGKTAATINGLKKTIEGLTSNALTLDKLVEIGLFSRTEDGKFALAGAAPPSATKQEPGQPTAQELALQRRIEAMETERKKEREQLDTERRRTAEISRNTAIQQELQKAGAMRPDRDYVHIAANVVQDENGSYVVKGKDKYGADTSFTVTEYVEKFLTENPELKKAPASNGGSGTTTQPQQRNAPAPGSTHNGKPVIPKSTWSNAQWYMDNSDKVFRGEVVLSKD